MSIIKHQDRTLGGGGGHKVLNSQGTEMTDRPNLQFLGMQVTDDNANGKTVVQGPSVPTALSAFTNDTNFIDNTVSNLTNYYTKTESYTKTEVNTLINSAKTGRFIVVSVLPTEDIDTTAIYLLPKSLTSSSNIKDEYINLDGTSTGWEKIGDTEIDLSAYATTAAMNTALSSKVDKNGTDSLMTAEERTKLSGIAAGAEVNVQSDWNQTNDSADDFIKNKPTIQTYNFNGDAFYSTDGTNTTITKDCNALTANGHYYYTSNGPSTSIGATTNDGALFVQGYNDDWVTQIAQDYRTGNLFKRARNNRVWTDWEAISGSTELHNYVDQQIGNVLTEEF